MKKRIFLVVILTLLLTGCNAKYEIEFVDKSIKENTSILFDVLDADKNVPIVEDGLEDSGTAKTYRDHLEINYKEKSYAFLESTSELYKKEKINNDEYVGLKYSYEYNVDNYKKSSNANYCYKYFNFLNSGDLYILSTNKECDCFLDQDLDNLSISIKTNHKVKKSNADRVEGYNYYWDINKNNYKSKSIYVEFYKDKYVFNYENKVVYILIGIGIGLLVLLIVFVIMKIKTKKNNRI